MNSPDPANEEYTEALTRRERGILLLLAAEKSNQEIANLETLSLNSVKWYVQRVFIKLGVNRRRDAIEKARQLGLLKTDSTGQSHMETPMGPKHNLPAQLTSFIGRENELTELRNLLARADTRLLTLIGSGGVGKTRLALQVARGLIDAYPDGVWQVELAPLDDPLNVPKAVIQALRQVEQVGKTPTIQLVDTLREKRLLLILDNCEHLVEACAELAHILLTASEGLKILATSREILGVTGEIPFRVPPFSFPNPKSPLQWEFLVAFESVRLFVDRAHVVSPGFSITQDNAVAVAQITQRLDGIPLAIELAAARLRLLNVRQIAQRLDDAFRLLTGGARTELSRHQTLTALIEWSFNLLDEAEQGSLRGLSVFAGGWTLSAAEAVCWECREILDLLGQLVDKSLVLAEPQSNGEMRYRMLETVRQYANGRLLKTGEAELVRRRHLEYYLGLVERLEPNLRGRAQIETLNILDGELDNLRVALEWALQSDVQAELRMASALNWFWHIRFHWAEGIDWLEKGLEKWLTIEKKDNEDHLQQRDELVYAKALSTLGFLLSNPDLALLEKGRADLEESLSLYEVHSPGDIKAQGWILVKMGFCEFWLNNRNQARILAEKALVLFQECGDLQGQAECLQILGNCETDIDKKLAIFNRQLTVVKANEDCDGIATAIGHVGGAQLQSGNYSEAWDTINESREYYRRVGNPHTVAGQTLTLGVLSNLIGELDRATLEFEEGYRLHQEIGIDPELVFDLFWRFFLAYAQGNYNLIDELIGSMELKSQKTADPLYQTGMLYHRARLARLRGDLLASRGYAEKGLEIGNDLGYPKMLILLELGYLALNDQQLDRARDLFALGVQTLVANNEIYWLGCILDGLGLLAASEGKWSQAAALVGARHYHGFFHTLSPIERFERQKIFTKLRIELGQECFDRLREQGSALRLTQVLTLAQGGDFSSLTSPTNLI